MIRDYKRVFYFRFKLTILPVCLLYINIKFNYTTSDFVTSFIMIEIIIFLFFSFTLFIPFFKPRLSLEKYSISNQTFIYSRSPLQTVNALLK